jgi:hypothetical protein
LYLCFYPTGFFFPVSLFPCWPHFTNPLLMAPSSNWHLSFPFNSLMSYLNLIPQVLQLWKWGKTHASCHIHLEWILGGSLCIYVYIYTYTYNLLSEWMNEANEWQKW